MLRCERRTAHQRQLLGMHFHGQIQLRCRVEHALRLFQRERNALAEHIDGIDQTFSCERRQHLIADVGDVVIRATRVFRRQRVCAEERRGYCHWPRRRQSPCHAQHLAFGSQVQPITRFDFERRHAFGEQRIQPAQRLREQFVFARGARVAHRRDDAAAAFRDVFVTHAFEPHREFFRAISCVDEVRMAIDETRRDDPSFQIVAYSLGKLRRHVSFRAEPFDTPVAHDNRRVFQYVCRVGARRETRDAPDVQAVIGHVRVSFVSFETIRASMRTAPFETGSTFNEALPLASKKTSASPWNKRSSFTANSPSAQTRTTLPCSTFSCSASRRTTTLPDTRSRLNIRLKSRVGPCGNSAVIEASPANASESQRARTCRGPAESMSTISAPSINVSTRSIPSNTENPPASDTSATLTRQSKASNAEPCGDAAISRVAPPPFFHGTAFKSAARIMLKAENIVRS